METARTQKRKDRRWTRYLNDHTSVVQLDIKNRSIKFTPTHNALLINEAFKGCGVVVNASDEFTVGEILKVKVGELEPLEAEIRWIEKLDNQVYKLGLFYLD